MAEGEEFTASVEASIMKEHRVLATVLNAVAFIGTLIGVLAVVVGIVDQSGSAFAIGGSLIGLAIMSALGMVVIDISRDVKRLYFLKG